MLCPLLYYCHAHRSIDGDDPEQALVSGTPSVATAAGPIPAPPPLTSLDPATARLAGESGEAKEREGAARAGVVLDKHPGLGVSLFCTGDEDQHIYGWRGTTVDHLHRHVLS